MATTAGALGVEFKAEREAVRSHQVWRTSALVGAGLWVVGFVVWQTVKAVSVDSAFAGDLRVRLVFALTPYLVIVGIAALGVVSGRAAVGLAAGVTYVGVGALGTPTVSGGVFGQWDLAPPAARFASLVVIGVPCVAAWLAARPRRTARPSIAAPQLAGCAAVIAGAAIVVIVRGVLTGATWDLNLDLTTLGVLAGVAISGRRTLLLPACVLSMALSPDVQSWLASGRVGGVPATEAGVLAVLTIIGAGQQLFSTTAAHLVARPRQLAISVNALNVADAVATELLLRSGAGTEANPVVRAIGLPAKVIFGYVAIRFVAKHRPSALLVPFVVLAMVLAWHVAGLVI